VEAHIKINRADLIAKLQAKIDEITANYQVEIDKYQALADSKYDHAAATAKWFAKVAKMLKAGEIRTTAAGNLASSTKSVPEKPKKEGHRYEVEHAKYYLEQIKQNLERDTQELSTAIELLEMSAEVKVPVSTADYHRLLGSTTRRY